jgi:gliding motility-associated-like protein
LVSSGTGCADSTTKIIKVNPKPVASYTFSANCQNTPVVFTNTSSISSGSLVSWNWNFADGHTSVVQNPSNLFDTSSVHNVVLIVTSDSGCTATATQAVTTHPLPVAGFTSLINCKSLTVSFKDTSTVSSGTVTSYSWIFGDGGTSSTQNPSYTYPSSTSYIVKLIVQTNNGCVDTSTVPITPGSPVLADYTPNGGNYNVSQNIAFTNLSTGGTSYIWNFGDGSTVSNLTDPSHGFSAPGTYTVLLAAVNKLGCNDSVSYDFVISSTGTAAPTGFTPNNDGLNDYFYIIGNFIAYDLRVFNEWGNEIFMSKDQSDKWDGKYKGKEQPAGTYIYIFNGKVVDGSELKMNGEVNLIR